MRRQYATILTLCAMSVWCFLAVRYLSYVLISGQRSSDSDPLIYQVADVHGLVVGSAAAVLVNTEERIVVEFSLTFARRPGPLVLWPRDVMRGVMLGDRVKGDE